MKKSFKLLSILMIAAVAIAFLPACGQSQAAKISSPALVSKVTQYNIDYASDDESWIEQASFEYEYKDGYPVSYTKTEGGEARTTDFKYEFADGKPVSMTRGSEGGDASIETIYNQKGLVSRVRTYEKSGRKIGEQVFQYGNRDEYFTLVLHENIISPEDEPVVDHMEETDSVMITAENGLLRKTVNDGLFANYNDEEEKLWRRFDGSYTANYDENGIISDTIAIFRSFPGSGKQYKFDLTVEDGRVAEAVRSSWIPAETAAAGDESAEMPDEDYADFDEDKASAAAADDNGSWEADCKFVFEYTEDEISQARYASMINYFLLEGGGNYYIYNWY